MLANVEKNEDLSICEEWLNPVDGYKNFVTWAYRDSFYMEQPSDTPEDEL